MIYFVVYIVLVILALKFINISHPNGKFTRSLSFVCLIFVIVAGLRYEIGIDYFAYQSYFDDEVVPIGKLFSSDSSFLQDMFSGWEPGCVILFSILRTLFSDSQIIFLVSSIICSLLLFKSLKSFCDPKFLFFSLLIYFSFVYMYQEMHALRQALGANLFYWGLTKYPNKRKVLCYTFIAGCFHFSLLLFVPIVFFLDRAIKPSLQVCILGISFVIFLLNIPWMSGLINLFSSMFPDFALVIKLVSYMSMEDFSRPFFITFIFYIIPYLLLLYHLAKNKETLNSKLLIAQNLYFLYLIFTMIFWENAYFSIRYGWICLFGMAVILPRMIPMFKQRIIPLAYIALFCYIPISTFLFPDIVTSQFTPYENYISVKILGKKSTGRERAEEAAIEAGASF